MDMLIIKHTRGTPPQTPFFSPGGGGRLGGGSRQCREHRPSTPLPPPFPFVGQIDDTHTYMIKGSTEQIGHCRHTAVLVVTRRALNRHKVLIINNIYIYFNIGVSIWGGGVLR